jgi:hypothetical protein
MIDSGIHDKFEFPIVHGCVAKGAFGNGRA